MTMTQNFRVKGEIAPKSNPTERWRIIDTYSTSCYIKKVNSNEVQTIDYEELDRDWMPYRKPKTEPEVIESMLDNFGNELKVGDEVYYATSMAGGRGYTLEKGIVEGFTPCYVILSTGYVTPDKIGKIFAK